MIPATTEKTMAQQLIDTCQLCYQRGYIPGHSGNLSVRDEVTYWVTPSGWSLGQLDPEQLVQLDEAGNNKNNNGLTPSSEWIVHHAVYNARPDVNAVIHAHPVQSTTLAVTGEALDKPIIPELIVSLGEVPLVPYFLPGTQALADSVAKYIQDHTAVLLANHGVIVTGRTITEAFYNLELLESFAQIYIQAKLLGGMSVLSRDHVKKIEALKEAMPDRPV